MPALLERNQQITQTEAANGLLVAYNHGSILEGADALWYVDNRGALESLIKGYSGSLDTAALVGVALLRLPSRHWTDTKDYQSSL